MSATTTPRGVADMGRIRGRNAARGLRIGGLSFVVLVCVACVAPPSPAAEIGQCNQLTKNTTPKAKHGKYTEASCLTLFEKKGKAEAKGGFEWFPGPAPSCVPRKHGAWANASCTIEAAKPGKGSFEREPCYGSGNGCAEYGSASTKTELQTLPFSDPIECTSSTDVGEITGATSGLDTVTLRNCTDFADTYTCRDGLGSPAGDIATLPLETTLSSHVGRGGDEVWYTLAGTNPSDLGVQGVTLVFCEETVGGGTAGTPPFIVYGSASGTVGPLNVMSKTFVEAFSAGVGAQNLRTEICPSTPCIEAPDVLTMRALVATNAAYEIKP